MSLPSLYLSGDDEEEIFRLIDPDKHPDANDESVAREEVASLASSDYADLQDESDEGAQTTRLANDLENLDDDELAEIIRVVEDIQNRRQAEQ